MRYGKWLGPVAVIAGCAVPPGAFRPAGGAQVAPPPLPGPCDHVEPRAATGLGAARHGPYDNQKLPPYFDTLPDAAALHKAIGEIRRGGNWACFEALFPGAATIYLGLEASGPPAPSVSPSSTPSSGVSSPPPTPRTSPGPARSP